MKAIYLIILPLLLCFSAIGSKACSSYSYAKADVINKKNGGDKQSSFQIIANASIATPHAPNRLSGDGKSIHNITGFKNEVHGFCNNTVAGACLLKAYLAHIYPTHTTW